MARKIKPKSLLVAQIAMFVFVALMLARATGSDFAFQMPWSKAIDFREVHLWGYAVGFGAALFIYMFLWSRIIATEGC